MSSEIVSDGAHLAFRIVGAGRAGRSMAAALTAVGGRSVWHFAGFLHRGDNLRPAAHDVDLLLIATPDDAVRAVARLVEPVPTTVVAHLAGSLGLDVLEPHERRAAVHPLVSLPDVEVGAARLRDRAWFAVAGDPLATRVVDALGGRSFVVADGDRAAYHAAASIAANHLVALLAQVERIAERAGVPFGAYLELVRTTLDNVARMGPAAALTGPAARGDEATIRRHLDALDPNERPAYAILADLARALAQQRRDQS